MIVVHHTITTRNDLEKKWLHDPATVVPRKGGKPPALPGDLVKTAAVAAKERERSPGLLVTLILSTNQEPPEALVRNVAAAGVSAGITVEIWGRSRLAHFLDTEPNGQWLRKQFLGIEQERLSRTLLQELSARNIEMMRPTDSDAPWVTRQLDRELAALQGRQVIFVAAESGLGKSVACYKLLSAHVERGGAGLVLRHEVVAQSLSFEQAIDAVLCCLHPKLPVGSGIDALALSSVSEPFVAVIEDVNRSEHPAVLLEKIAAWTRTDTQRQEEPTWQVLCPVWPQVLSSLGDQARRQIDAMAVRAGAFTADEGVAAVKRRAAETGGLLSDVVAGSIAEALGNDPLLIALHDTDGAPEPRRVIGRYINASLRRSATALQTLTAGEYRDTLRRLGTAMLRHRIAEPAWRNTSTVLELSEADKNALRDLARRSEVIRIAEDSRGEHIAFRHDRVRDAILIDAGRELMRTDKFPGSGLDDPYFSEITGAVLADSDPPVEVIEEITARNPLALFAALREFRESHSEVHRAILAAIDAWLTSEGTGRPSSRHLRWHAQRILAETDSSLVPGIVARLPDQTSWPSLKARFRNADFSAGLALCWNFGPGVRASGHLELIKHVRTHHGPQLLSFLDEQLRRGNLSNALRVGALRLAGHLSDPLLADAIAQSWSTEADSVSLIDEYLWAAVTCCGDDPPRLLAPICALWATLPEDESDRAHRAPTRTNVVAGNFRFAFQAAAPTQAICYLIEKARSEAGLRWPIIYLMDGVDYPDAVEFVAREMAAINEQLEGTSEFSPFTMRAGSDWQRRQENSGVAMSEASRTRVSGLWQDQELNKFLRRAACGVQAVGSDDCRRRH